MPTNSDNSDRNRGDTAHDWERGWREDVNEAIKTLSEQQQQTALIMRDLMTRLTIVEARPVEERARFSMANQGAGTLIAVGAALIALLGVVLQHVTFH